MSIPMSIPMLSSSSIDPEKPYMKTPPSTIRCKFGRNNSGELHVFDAANYYSSSAQISCVKTLSEEEQKQTTKPERRISFDFPIKTLVQEDQHTKPSKEKNKNTQQQPDSPGGRLVRYLNSFFRHSEKLSKISNSSSPKTPKSHSAFYSVFTRTTRTNPSVRNPIQNSEHDHDLKVKVHPNPSISSVTASSSPPKNTKPHSILYSVWSSGFTPTSRNLRPNPEHFRETKVKIQPKSLISPETGSSSWHIKKNVENRKSFSWLDERVDNVFLTEKKKKRTTIFEKSKNRVSKEMGKYDDGDSDSSSDLFELENYDLGVCSSSSSGLPVYETTNMEKMKRASAIISNGI